MEFLETLETIRAEEASRDRLFSGAGRSLRNRSRDPQYIARLAEAARFVADVFEGRRPGSHLREAMTSSDFPQLFGDILDRQLYASYAEAPYSWSAVARRSVVPDFRTVKRFVVDGAEGLLSDIAEKEEYPKASLSDNQYTYQVTKRGKKAKFSFEAMVNDDLDGLKSMPARFAKAARRSEEYFVTSLFVDTAGPHASMFTSGNKNIINTSNGAASNNPPLSIQGIQDGFKVMANQLDADGQPIMVEGMVLAVPPALEVTAYNIVNASQLELTTAGGTADGATSGSGGQRLITANWLRNRLKVVVNYYIPLIATASNGNSSWFLFADPSKGRPALEVGFLRGHEQPELFMKAPDTLRVGGGAADVMSGAFENDSIEYKVRHIFGGTRIDGKACVSSNGSGS